MSHLQSVVGFLPTYSNIFDIGFPDEKKITSKMALIEVAESVAITTAIFHLSKNKRHTATFQHADDISWLHMVSSHTCAPRFCDESSPKSSSIISIYIPVGLVVVLLEREQITAR